MKNKFIYLLVALVFAFTACDEPGSDTIFSETFVELRAANTSIGSETYSLLRINDNQNVPSGFEVLLSSQPLTNAVNITFEIVAATTTAIEGVHYVVNSNSLTIAAGENIGSIPIDIIDDGINPGEQWDIDIRLVSADVRVAEEFAQAVHTVQVTCPSDIAGTFNTTASGDRGDGSGGSAGTYGPISSTVTLMANGSTSYTLSDASFGMYAQVYGDNIPVDGRVDDVCDAISDNGISDRFGDPFTIAGSRNPATGVITLTWSNTWGDTGTVTMTPQ